MVRSQRQVRSQPHTLLWWPLEGTGEGPTHPGLPANGTNLVLQSKHHPASSVRHQNLLCYREDTVAAPRESDTGIPMDKASTHHAKVHVSKAAVAGSSEGHHYCEVKSCWKMFSFTCGTAHLTCHHCLLVLLQPEFHIWLAKVLSSTNLSVAFALPSSALQRSHSLLSNTASFKHPAQERAMKKVRGTAASKLTLIKHVSKESLHKFYEQKPLRL